MNLPAANERRDLNNSIEGMTDGEQKLAEIRKHPFGIIILYVEVGVAVAILLGLMYFLVPQFFSGDNSSQANGILALAGLVTIGVALVVLFIASIVYHQSYLIMTDKNVTQVLQKSLFKRQVSELSMANVEDVTAHQNGVFATIFNFGQLVVETAGEQNNFIFDYCPRPNYYGKILLDARQRFIDGDVAAANRANNRLNLPPAQPLTNQQPYQAPADQPSSEQPNQTPPPPPQS